METYSLIELERLSINQLRSIASKHKLGGVGKKIVLIDKIFKKLGKKQPISSVKDADLRGPLLESDIMSVSVDNLSPVKDTNHNILIDFDNLNNLKPNFRVLYDKLYRLCHLGDVDVHSERLIFDSILEVSLRDYDDIDFSQISNTTEVMKYIDSTQNDINIKAVQSVASSNTLGNGNTQEGSSESLGTTVTVVDTDIEGQKKAIESLRNIIHNTDSSPNSKNIISTKVLATPRPVEAVPSSIEKHTRVPALASNRIGTRITNLTIQISSPGTMVDATSTVTKKKNPSISAKSGSVSGADVVNPLGWALCATPKKGNGGDTVHTLSPVAEDIPLPPQSTVKRATGGQGRTGTIPVSTHREVGRNTHNAVTGSFTTPVKSNSNTTHTRTNHATPSTIRHRSVATPQPRQAAKEPQRVMPHTSVKTKKPIGSLNVTTSTTPAGKLVSKTSNVMKPLYRMVKTPSTASRYPHSINTNVHTVHSTATAMKTPYRQQSTVIVGDSTTKCDKENDRGIKKSEFVTNPFMEIIDNNTCI